jgi:hypothetical protein
MRLPSIVLSATSASAAMVLLGWAGPASAASVLPYTVPSGQAPCSTLLQQFGALTETRVTSVFGTTPVVVGGQTINVTVSPDGRSLDWESSDVPPSLVACVSIKGGSGNASSNLYSYVPQQSSDTDLIAPGGGNITQYTVAVGDVTGFVSGSLPLCSEVEGVAGQCPDNQTPLVITTWNLDDPTKPIACTCNATFTACDPDPAASDSRCFGGNSGHNLSEVPGQAGFLPSQTCYYLYGSGGTPRYFCK